MSQEWRCVLQLLSMNKHNDKYRGSIWCYHVVGIKKIERKKAWLQITSYNVIKVFIDYWLAKSSAFHKLAFNCPKFVQWHVLVIR
jgi:hypothetical protein